MYSALAKSREILVQADWYTGLKYPPKYSNQMRDRCGQKMEEPETKTEGREGGFELTTTQNVKHMAPKSKILCFHLRYWLLNVWLHVDVNKNKGGVWWGDSEQNFHLSCHLQRPRLMGSSSNCQPKPRDEFSSPLYLSSVPVGDVASPPSRLTASDIIHYTEVEDPQIWLISTLKDLCRVQEDLWGSQFMCQ